MDAVTLKGRKEGYELQLADGASMAELTAGLGSLLTKLATDTPEGDVEFLLTTGNRLLTQSQRDTVEAAFKPFTRFHIKSIQAAVADPTPLRAEFMQHSLHLVGGTIRSGQLVEHAGDVLFVGTLHPSGTLRATGSIFVLGTVEGLLIAGANGDDSAVIVGDVSHAAQLRIADTVEIVADEAHADKRVCFINDLHILDHGDTRDLQQLRPKLFRKLEDM